MTTLAQIIQDIENAIETTETDVQSWIAQVASGVAVVESDLQSGLAWVASQAPAWIAAIESALALVQAIPGLTIPASIAQLVADALAALNAVTTAVSAGESLEQVLLAAYNAIVGAKLAQATVLSLITKAPTPANKLVA